MAQTKLFLNSKIIIIHKYSINKMLLTDRPPRKSVGREVLENQFNPQRTKRTLDDINIRHKEKGRPTLLTAGLAMPLYRRLAPREKLYYNETERNPFEQQKLSDQVDSQGLGANANRFFKVALFENKKNQMETAKEQQVNDERRWKDALQQKEDEAQQRAQGNARPALFASPVVSRSGTPAGSPAVQQLDFYTASLQPQQQQDETEEYKQQSSREFASQPAIVPVASFGEALPLTSDQDIDEFSDIDAPQQLQQELAGTTEKIDQITERFQQGLQSILEGAEKTPNLATPAKSASSAELPISPQVMKQLKQEQARSELLQTIGKALDKKWIAQTLNTAKDAKPHIKKEYYASIRTRIAQRFAPKLSNKGDIHDMVQLLNKANLTVSQRAGKVEIFDKLYEFLMETLHPIKETPNITEVQLKQVGLGKKHKHQRGTGGLYQIAHKHKRGSTLQRAIPIKSNYFML